jgi:hypothetical protein
MPIDQILFSSVSRESSSKKSASLLRDSALFMERSKGIQRIFDIGVCGFSWALLAPFSSEARPFLEQGRCIAHICKATFRAPELVMQGHNLWNRGEGVRDATVSVAKRLKNEPLERPVLRHVASVAKDTFAWGSSVVSWGCRMLGFAGKEVLQIISVDFPDQIARVGVNAGLASVGMSVFNTSADLREALHATKPNNRLLEQVHATTVHNLMYQTTSLVVRFISLTLTAMRLCALYPIMPIITLVTSTASLGLGIAASETEKPSVIAPKRISLVA